MLCVVENMLCVVENMLCVVENMLCVVENEITPFTCLEIYGRKPLNQSGRPGFVQIRYKNIVFCIIFY